MITLFLKFFLLMKLTFSSIGTFNISNQILQPTNETKLQSCIPGESYTIGCNTCHCVTRNTTICSQSFICNKNQTNISKQKTNRNKRDLGTAIENQVKYPMLPKEECESGSFYKVNCKLCFCDNYKNVTCAPKRCNHFKFSINNSISATPEDLIPSLSSEEHSKLPNLSTKFDHCEPGRVYSVDCNTCLCLSARNLLCDSLLCLDYDQLNEWLARDLNGKPCTDDHDDKLKSECVKCTCGNGLSKCEPVPACVQSSRRSIHGVVVAVKYPNKHKLPNCEGLLDQKHCQVSESTKHKNYNLNKLLKTETKDLEIIGQSLKNKEMGKECENDSFWNDECNICFCVNGYAACTKRACLKPISHNKANKKVLKGLYGVDWVMFPDDKGDFHYANLNQKLKKYNVEQNEHVSFFIYTRRNRNTGREIKLTTGKINFLFKSLRKVPLKILVHGWRASGTSDMVIKMKDAYLKVLNVNVLVVHWMNLASSFFYVPAVSNAEVVGEQLGELINKLIKEYRINPKLVHIIGHSLGAHIAGYAGRYLKKTRKSIGRITGLDPAKPSFVWYYGINSEDADFVDIIHTNAGILGIGESRGKADFYPNGGRLQFGCDSIMRHLFDCCNHSRSYKYFIESILNGGFLSYKCKSYQAFEAGTCRNNQKTFMGEHCNSSARGIYFVKTNPIEPFSIEF